MSEIEIIASLLLVIMLLMVLGIMILNRKLNTLEKKSALDTTSENYTLLKIKKVLEEIHEEIRTDQVAQHSAATNNSVKKIGDVSQQYVIEEMQYVIKEI